MNRNRLVPDKWINKLNTSFSHTSMYDTPRSQYGALLCGWKCLYIQLR